MLLLSWKPFFGIRGISRLRSHLSQKPAFRFFCAKCHSTCPWSYQPSALGSTFNRCKQASKHHPNETMNPATTLLLCLLGTTEKTRPSGGNKTGLLTLGGVSGDGRSLTNMLMVTLCPLSALLFHSHKILRIRTPPWGWSTGFMATPRVLGQLLRLTANLCLAREASAKHVSDPMPHFNFRIPRENILRRGLSVRPPPATIPIIPREPEWTTFLAPEGSLMRVLPSSGLWPTMVM